MRFSTPRQRKRPPFGGNADAPPDPCSMGAVWVLFFRLASQFLPGAVTFTRDGGALGGAVSAPQAST